MPSDEARGDDAGSCASDEGSLTSEARWLRALLAHSTDVIVVLDAQGELTYVSPTAERVLGLRPADWVGRSVFDLVHPDDLGDAAESFVSTTEAAGVKEPLDVRVRAGDGTWRTLEVMANNMLDDPAVAGVIINAREVSDRRDQQARLREAEVRFKEVFDKARIGMAILRLDRRFVRVNQAFCDLVGTTAPGLLATSPADLLHPDDKDEAARLFADIAAGTIDHFDHEGQIRRADGTWVWMRVFASLVRDEHDAPAYAIAQCEDVTQRREVEAQLAHDATHDRLTGLANRTMFLEHLDRSVARAKRVGDGLGVLFVDLDRFKQVNDLFGHAYGDALLVEVGERLRRAVRACDVPARLGGDEFVVMCPELRSVDDAVTIGERISRSIRAPFTIEGRESHVGASVGIAFGRGFDCDDGETLLTHADTAAYRAKERGRNRIEVFDQALGARLVQRVVREASLRRSLARAEIDLELRPVARIEDRRVVGFEARTAPIAIGGELTGGDEIVRAAEESGLLRDLTRIVLGRACRVGARWADEFPGRDLTITLRLSASQFLMPRIAEDVRTAVVASGIEPARLWLAADERALVRDADGAAESYRSLAELGVTLGIGEFGATLSALEQMRGAPLQFLGLHESLVAETGEVREGSTIVAAVTALAREIGLLIVADGVGDLEHLAALLGVGCGLATGPLFGPALRPEQVAAALAAEGADVA